MGRRRNRKQRQLPIARIGGFLPSPAVLAAVASTIASSLSAIRSVKAMRKGKGLYLPNNHKKKGGSLRKKKRSMRK